MGYIVDISEHQLPSRINYDQFASECDLAIVRVQYGSAYVDRQFQTHITELQHRGVPVAVYAWVRGGNTADMEAEATQFYNLASQYNPVFWFLDIEEQTMGDMVGGCRAFRNKLKSLGAKKVGAYIANHKFASYGFNYALASEYDAIWVPSYGANPTCLPYQQIDIHQYTESGRMSGYAGNLDLNKLTGKRPLEYFTNQVIETKQEMVQQLKEEQDMTEFVIVYNNAMFYVCGMDMKLLHSATEWDVLKSMYSQVQEKKTGEAKTILDVNWTGNKATFDAYCNICSYGEKEKAMNFITEGIEEIKKELAK